MLKYDWIRYSGTPTIADLPWKGQIVYADYLFKLANEHPSKKFELRNCAILFKLPLRELRQDNVSLIDCMPVDLEVL